MDPREAGSKRAGGRTPPARFFVDQLTLNDAGFLVSYGGGGGPKVPGEK